MVKLLSLRKGWLSSFVVLAFLMVAGMNFGTQPEAEFNEVETALENAIAGSEDRYICCQTNRNITCTDRYGFQYDNSVKKTGVATCSS